MILVVSFLEPAKENRRILLKNTTAIIGRDDLADIRLNHFSVSREHAHVTLVEGKSHFTVEDRDSANGTYVDGVRLNGRSTLYPDEQLEPGRHDDCLHS